MIISFDYNTKKKERNRGQRVRNCSPYRETSSLCGKRDPRWTREECFGKQNNTVNRLTQ